MMSNSLADFWPPATHCHECFITEAETADDAVFLAVHQPMRVVRHRHGVTNATPEIKCESDVLEAFLDPDPPSGTLVLPITGGSGVGKSHLIRWLDANLRLRPDRKKRHVVRIPKSASLHGVLELILKGRKEAHYSALREKLVGARMPTKLLDATRRLQANLLVALENAGRDAKQRLLDGQPRYDDQARKAHCSEKGLMALLQDPEIQQHFMADDAVGKGVLVRIADRCLNGSLNSEQGPQNVFQESDLDFISQENLANLSATARSYIALLRQQPINKIAAIAFLNEVVDAALGQLPDFGGVSLAELFVEIRQRFLADGLELVILIEDFAVLAGIQSHLLAAMVREGIRGRRELCIMRTALAVTEGRLPESVMTRAHAEWKIDSKPFRTSTEAIENFTDFVGGYLNAARWGASSLRQSFDEYQMHEDFSDRWIPNFDQERRSDLTEEQRRRLDAFGTSTRGGYSLFPFNKGAVRQLARLYLREGDIYRFDPRLLIRVLLRDTLINYRDTFVAGDFPPVGLHQFSENKLELDVSRELKTKAPAQFSRISVLVYFWGDNPRTLGQAAALHSEIYRAFGISPIKWSAKAEVAPVEETPSAKPESPPVQEADQLLGDWRVVLENWREKGELGQREANTLRGYLDRGISEYIDWDALLLRRVAARNKKMYLPGARQGNPPANEAVAIVATEADLKDIGRSNEFFSTIRAVVRYENAKTWNYHGGEQDAALYGNLIEDLASQARNYVLERGTELRPEMVTPIAQALLIGARLLNVDGASSNTDADNIQAIFAPSPGQSGVSTQEDSLSAVEAGARHTRDDLRTLLLQTIAARQGGGPGVQAVDASRLLEAVVGLRKSGWQLPADFNSELFKDQLPAIREHLRELKKLPSYVDERRARVERWREKVLNAFGNEFDAQSLSEDLLATVKEANDAGVFRPREPAHDILRRRVREMGPIKETLAQADRVCAPDSGFGVKLSALAQIDARTMSKVDEVISDFERFLTASLAEVEERLKDAPPGLDETAAALKGKFEELDQLWTTIEATLND
jgi:hypothetical protein